MLALVSGLYLIVPLFLVTSILAPLCQAVDIVLHDDFLDEATTETCPNHPPGICCRRLIHHPTYRFYAFEVAEFTGLHEFDIASIWETNTSPDDYASETSSGYSWSSDTSHDDDKPDPLRWTSGCGGVVKEAKAGPGPWAYKSPPTRGPADVWEGVSGANYVSGEGRIPFLQSDAAGMRAFLGGGGRLFSSGKDTAVFDPDDAKALKVGPDEAAKMIKTVSGWAQTRDWVYPALINIRGKEYRQRGGGKSRVYIDGGGKQLDLSIYDTKPKGASAGTHVSDAGKGPVICIFGKRCCADASYVEKAAVKAADVLYGVLSTMQGVGFCTS